MMDLNLIPADYAALLATGMIAGYIGGLLGLGGGVIMVPVLFELLPHVIGPHPQTAQVAVATSLGCVFFTSVSSAHAHHGKRNIDWRLAALAAPMSAAGAFVVTRFALRIGEDSLKIAFGIFLAVMAVRLWLFDSARTASDDEPVRGAPQFAKGALTGILIGSVGGMFGIGGGSLAVPAFVLLMHKPVHRAVGTSSVVGAASGLVGTAGYLTAVPSQPVPGGIGIVIPGLVILLAVASIFFAQLGARHATRMEPAKLRRTFAFALCLMGFFVVYRTVTG